jgi:hypothetical protein
MNADFFLDTQISLDVDSNYVPILPSRETNNYTKFTLTICARKTVIVIGILSAIRSVDTGQKFIKKLFLKAERLF